MPFLKTILTISKKYPIIHIFFLLLLLYAIRFLPFFLRVLLFSSIFFHFLVSFSFFLAIYSIDFRFNAFVCNMQMVYTKKNALYISRIYSSFPYHQTFERCLKYFERKYIYSDRYYP